jgi:hypothetical protein
MEKNIFIMLSSKICNYGIIGINKVNQNFQYITKKKSTGP